MKNIFEILIIDDNLNFVKRMVDLLTERDNHWEIKTASNYDQAIQSLQHSDPEIILLDINLPGKNGIEILRQIRLNGKSGDVIMITNHVDEYYRLQCRELGAAHFMDKSYDFALIPGIIDARQKSKAGINIFNEQQ